MRAKFAKIARLHNCATTFHAKCGKPENVQFVHDPVAKAAGSLWRGSRGWIEQWPEFFSLKIFFRIFRLFRQTNIPSCSAAAATEGVNFPLEVDILSIIQVHGEPSHLLCSLMKSFSTFGQFLASPKYLIFMQLRCSIMSKHWHDFLTFSVFVGQTIRPCRTFDKSAFVVASFNLKVSMILS